MGRRSRDALASATKRGHRDALRHGATAPPQAAGAMDRDCRTMTRTVRWYSGCHSRLARMPGARSTQRPALAAVVVADAGGRPGGQQHHLQSAGRTGAASVSIRGRRSAAGGHDHGARRHVRRSRERLGRRFARMEASAPRPSRNGRCTCGGTRTCREWIFPKTWPGFYVSPGFFSLLGVAAGARPRVPRRGEPSRPASARRARPRPVAAAIRRRPADRRQVGALRRRAVRSGRRRAGGFQDSGRRRGLGAAGVDRRAMGQSTRRTPTACSRASPTVTLSESARAEIDVDHRDAAPRFPRHQQEPPGARDDVHRTAWPIPAPVRSSASGRPPRCCCC